MDSLIKKALAKQPTVKPRTKRNAQPEAIEQAKVIAWARANERNYPFLWMLHSSLNGVKMTKAQAVRAIAQGMKKGVADLFLPVKKGVYSGLYIEMKSEKGRTSIDQSKFLTAVSENDYLAHICYSAVEAIDKIKGYYNQSN
jgi:hypothetical protein